MNLKKYKQNIRKKLKNFTVPLQWDDAEQWKNNYIYLFNFLDEEDKKNKFITNKEKEQLKQIYKEIYHESYEEYINNGGDFIDDRDLTEIFSSLMQEIK